MSEERYGNELDECAKMLQVLHPIGRYKAIGRLEVTTALKDIVDRLRKLENVALLARLVQEENRGQMRPILRRQGWEKCGLGWHHPTKQPRPSISTESACMLELDLALNELW